MRNLFICSFLFLSLLSYPFVYAGNGKTEFAIISDIHVMAPSLLIKEGKAFEDYVAHDRKMLKESSSLMHEVTMKLLEAHPKFIMITGDLTKDGEALSHRYLVDHYLAKIRQAGIKVFVIPGNHDVNNPHAVSFDGEKKTRVETLSSEEFADCYSDYGYGEALARDPHSLSYVAAVSDSLRILAIDACKYGENDFAENTCVTGGRIKPETMDFIREQVKAAHSKGIRLIAMMHHGLIQHWKWQDKVMKEYLVDNWKKQAKRFARLGIEVVFTGHFHAQDIVKRGSIYDIETGSTVTYPSPYRLATLEGNRLDIRTEHINRLEPSFTRKVDFSDYAQKYAREGIAAIVSHIMPASIPDSCKREAGSVVATAYVAHLAGDEQWNTQQQDDIKRVCKLVRRHSWKYAYILKHLSRNLWTDLSPRDNELTIYLTK